MIAVISDIHGCYHTLLELIKKIKKKYGDIPLYSVGDLVDRGNFSFEVIELIKSENIKFTKGNHDVMFYYFMKEPFNPLGQIWLYNDYEKTVKSYQENDNQFSEHLEIIKQAPLFYNTDDCFISHAGISNNYKNTINEETVGDAQKLESILLPDLGTEHSIIWCRGELIDIGKLQVVGHTAKFEVRINKKNNTAYIDTAVYIGNKLTAIIVEENKILDILSVRTNIKDIE
jgi:serine/threonine protein phosphatase 1